MKQTYYVDLACFEVEAESEADDERLDIEGLNSRALKTEICNVELKDIADGEES